MSDYLKESIALFGRMKQIRGTDANALSESNTDNWQPEVTVPDFYIGEGSGRLFDKPSWSDEDEAESIRTKCTQCSAEPGKNCRRSWPADARGGGVPHVARIEAYQRSKTKGEAAVDEAGVRCAKCHGFRNGREHQRSSPYFTHSFIPDWEGDNSVAAQGQ